MRPIGTRIRATIAAAVLGSLIGCADAPERSASAPAGAPGATSGLLVPVATLTGARLTPRTDLSGAPSIQSGLSGFQRFIRPSSVAGRDPDTYIADIGAGAVYRYDARFSVMVALAGVRAESDTQLHVGSDFSVYVVDPPRRRVLHFARTGQLLATFANELDLGRPVDVAVDEVRGRVLVADGLHNHLVAFHPLGRASYVIPLRSGPAERVFAVAAIAVGREGIFLSDPLCACIAQVAPDGAVLSTFGHHEIGRPGPIAVDRDQRVFVIDVFDGSLKVFLNGELIHDLQPGELGLQKANDVWVTDGQVILSDAIGATVKLMRLAPLPAR